MNPEQHDRLCKGIRRIQLTWAVSTALEIVIIAYSYAILMIHVVSNRDSIQAVRQALSNYGLDSQGYALTAVFSAFGIFVLGMSFLLRRLIVTWQKGGPAANTSQYSLGLALSRYGNAVLISSILAFLIPVAGVPLLLFTAAATEAFAAVIVLWGLGLLFTVPGRREFIELEGQRTEGIVPSFSAASQFSAEFQCTGMNLGHVRAPAGKLLVRPDELVIRTFLGLLGHYRLSADEVVALHLESSNWLSGLQVRIEHRARDVPGMVVLGFDFEPDAFFGEISSAGFAPRGSRSLAGTNSGIPVRISSLVVLVVLWNCLILLGLWAHTAFQTAAVLMLFACSILIPRWPLLASWIMKPGRHVGEIGPFLALTRAISAILLAGSAVGLLVNM